MKSFSLVIWELFKIILIAAVIVIPIRFFLIQPFFVKGASMEPNFDDGEYLIIDEISYRLREPARGEVIVFRFPGDPSQFYIKRIIGLPGETVEMVGGRIRISNKENPNGFFLNEASYLENIPNLGDDKITLAETEYFVMGDNRAASYDSRRWGPLPKKNIIGRAWLRAWPVSRAQILEAPIY
ncbi:MAG: signal peptidase I [Candidatus Portnoybacteria bacterium]|nr:signal peptidase I [Candidatus Portnoybacteria bacterium]